MAKPSIDIAELLARLSASTIFELRGEWRRLHRAPPPMRLSRDLLMRGITYKLQERPLGGLSKSIMRKLERLNLDSGPMRGGRSRRSDWCSERCTARCTTATRRSQIRDLQPFLFTD
jgi:hypothetical protein